MANRTLKYCENLITRYTDVRKGSVTQLEEGCLGLGKLILHDGYNAKTIIITEFYVSAWSSGHKVIMYNKMPKKYELLLTNINLD